MVRISITLLSSLMTIHLSQRYTMLAILVFGSLFYACNKENQLPAPDPVIVVNPPDDPQGPDPLVDSIRYVSLNTGMSGTASTQNFELESIDSSVFPKLIFRKNSLPAFFLRIEGGQYLDQGGYGYIDALNPNTPIGPGNYWRDGEGLLSTAVGTAGQFRGQSNRYAGFRFKDSTGYHYGWVRLSVNQAGDALTISDYAFRTGPDSTILSGQKYLGEVPTVVDNGVLTPITDLVELFGTYHSDQTTDCSVVLAETDLPGYDFTVQYFPFLWPYHKFPGKLVNGKLVIPSTSYEGNIPSPGGTDRFFWVNFTGTCKRYLKDGKTILLWDIDMDKTGFLPQSYHGEFWSQRCD